MPPRPPRPWSPPEERPARILLVRLSALGDVLHALPALGALRSGLPEARIDWVVEDRAAGLLQGRTDLDAVLVFPRRELRGLRTRPHRYARRAAAFVREMRAGDYDVALDLQGNLKSGIVTRLSGARLRFGLAREAAREGNHLFTSRRVLPPARARHRVERGLALVEALLGRPARYEPPRLTPVPAARAEAARLLAPLPPGARLAVLHPGTSGFGAFKRWPPERFGALARRLHAAGITVVVTASPEEAPLAAATLDAADGGAIAVSPPTLEVLAAVLERADLVVAADTAPLHLAAALGRPVLGLYGPKDAAIYGPYGLREDGRAGVLDVRSRDDVACRPCPLRACPAPVCMTGLAPEDVWRSARVLLGV